MTCSGDTGDVEDCTCRDGHLSKQMSYLGRITMLSFVLTVLLGVAARAPSATPVEVAADRCNSQTIDEASARIHDYDRHPPGSSSAQLVQRYGAIADTITVLSEEREILTSVCSSDLQRPLLEQIAATAAWALALESDVAGRLNASCPAAATGLPTMMLADAWLALASIVNDDSGAVPAAFTGVIPKIQTRAQAVGLTLPSWGETSAYWRDQVRTKAKASIATCPSPSPSPSPKPS
jgi:hypothetical protein